MLIINLANNHPLTVLAEDETTVLGVVPAGDSAARIVTTTTPSADGDLVTGCISLGGIDGLPEPVEGTVCFISLPTAAAYAAAVATGTAPRRDDLVVAGKNVVDRTVGPDGRPVTVIRGCVGLSRLAL